MPARPLIFLLIDNIGVFVDRKGMVNVLKEILDNCQEITSANVMIMPPNSNDTTSKGEQLHIMTNADGLTRQCLEGIIKRYNLALKVEADRIVVYEPATLNLAH